MHWRMLYYFFFDFFISSLLQHSCKLRHFIENFLGSALVDAYLYVY